MDIQTLLKQHKPTRKQATILITSTVLLLIGIYLTVPALQAATTEPFANQDLSEENKFNTENYAYNSFIINATQVDTLENSETNYTLHYTPTKQHIKTKTPDSSSEGFRLTNNTHPPKEFQKSIETEPVQTFGKKVTILKQKMEKMYTIQPFLLE